MKKKYLIVGLFSLLFGVSFSYGQGVIGGGVVSDTGSNISINPVLNLSDGIYHNSQLGLISVVLSGVTKYTIQDKNVGATCTNVNSSCSYGNYYNYNSCPSGYSILNWLDFHNTLKVYYTGIVSASVFYDFLQDEFLIPSAGYYLNGTYYSDDRMLYLSSSKQAVISRVNYYLNFQDVPGSWGSDWGFSVRCVKNDVVNPDSSWPNYNSPCDDLNGKTGTISIIESDSGTYYILTLGDGVACTLPNDFGLSGGAIQIQNNNTWSGTITIVDDSYITYTDLSGNTILITTGYDVNKGTWENILTAFSGHQLTIYETDSGTYYTFVDSNGQIKTADVNGVFQYLNEQLQFTGLQTGSYNMMTASRWYGQMLDKGRHFFQCGVDYGTKNVFSVRVSDYYYSAKVVEKLDTNLLGFMLCPFYSLLAGISDNFDNSTMMRSGYKPILNHTGYFNHGSSVNRGKFYSFFDATLIFVIFITYGSIFYFIIRKF